ncbi:DUF6907 domain-containing protein [Microlunatus sp. Y2014]|uniref:DUF6907 domain-containing protein n=1 Tax=Microlunatus sp. Y2014 TaxID=3418488 RepID=UPI003DA799F1
MSSVTNTCPTWCDSDHYDGDNYHHNEPISAERLHPEPITLFLSYDPDTDPGPLVEIGTDLYTIDQARELVAQLTRLTEEAGR